MYIGIDGIPLGAPKTGIGHYTFELARSLALIAPEYEFELVSPFPFEALDQSEARSGFPANLRATYTKPRGLKRHWWTLGLPLYVRRSALDLFHGTNYNVPLWNNCPTVVTIHDLTLYLYPETFRQHALGRALRRLPVMARTAKTIITPSEQVRREVCERLAVKSEKVVAIPEAARSTFRRVGPKQVSDTRRRLGVADEFILFVGTIEPRKNLLTLVRAFEEILKATSLRPQLVIAGKHGWQADELYSHLGQSGIGDRVRFTGYVADEDLCALYSSCRVCVYPSLYEGFGLPPLEAMACGAPVVTSRIPSITETVGEAARLVEPTDAQALAQALVDLLENEAARQHLSAAGIKRSAQFSWERTGRATLDVYRSILGTADGSRRSLARRQNGKKMPHIHKPEIRVEALTENLADGMRRENASAKGDAPPFAAPAPRVEDLPPSSATRVMDDPLPYCDRPLALQPEFQPRDDDCYNINDLVRFDDRNFVYNAYRAVLKRPADAAGFNSYLKGLREGGLDKIDVLARLRFSPEGRATGTRIEGLRLPALLRRAYRLPVAGYFVQLGAELLRLPVTLRRQKQLEARVFAQHQLIADHINRQLMELSTAIEASHRRTTEAVESHRNRTATSLESIRESTSESLRCLAEASQTLTAQQRQVNRVRADLEIARDETRALFIELGQRVSHISDNLASGGHATRPAATDAERREMDSLYAAFTDVFRGTRSEVKERLRIYLPIIRKASIGTEEMPILDLGCGRGEWLDLLREENLRARGIDFNHVFVAQCRESGLDVVEADLISYLRLLPGASLGAVTAFHVIEHLPPETLLEILDETIRVLKPGGAIIFETPNPQNVIVGSYSFNLDLSHHKPLPVPLMKFLFEAKGLKQIEVIGLQEAAEDRIEGDGEIVNRFNLHFYGSMDYAVIGWKAAR